MLKTLTVLLAAFVTCLACGAPRQSDACNTFSACCTKLYGAARCSESTYGAQGTCWTSTQAAADACTATCSSTNDSYLSSGLAEDAGCTFE